MGFIHISFSLAGVEANHYCIILCNLFSFEQIQDIDLQMNLCLLKFPAELSHAEECGSKTVRNGGGVLSLATPAATPTSNSLSLKLPQRGKKMICCVFWSFNF